MKHLRNLLIPILAGTIVIMLLLWPSDNAPVHHDTGVHCEYTPSDFNSNYDVDLKPDGYLIVDRYDGECYYVPFGELEDWFIEMNL